MFTKTGSQFPLSLDDVRNLIREYPVTRKRSNGAQSQFTLKGEYPAVVVANVYSEAHDLLTVAYRESRKRR